MKRQTRQTKRIRSKNLQLRLASFPELNPNPVGEIGLDGKIYYLNPAARRVFPSLKAKGLEHPWLAEWKSIVDILKKGKTNSTQREVMVNGRYYHQAIHYAVTDERIRVYSFDITEHERAREALRRERSFVSAVLDTVGALVVVLDRYGKIVRFNHACEQTTGYSFKQVKGKAIWDFLLIPEEIDQVKQVFGRLCKGDFPNTHENYWVARSGKRCLIAWNNTVVADHRGHVKYVVGTGVDITERNRIEHALRESEERFRLALKNVPVVVATLDRDLRYTWVYNTRHGFTPEQVLGKRADELIPPKEAAETILLQKQVLETGIGMRREIKGVTGGVAWVYDATSEPIRNDRGEIVGLRWIAMDITERKQMEEALRANKDDLERQIAERTAELVFANAQLHSLTQDTVATQEEERRRIARELHDEAGQALTALKMSLQMVQEDLAQQEELRQRIAQAVKLTDQTLEEIRMLAQDLRPPSLESAGLNATLEGFCSDFAQRTQIQINYTGTQLPDLPSAISICLYRIAQEALTNATRHGHANKIAVLLDSDSKQVRLTVKDDGVGFDPKAVFAKQGNPSSMGLIGMRERLHMLNGWLDIDSESGRGTCIVAHVPLEAP